MSNGVNTEIILNSPYYRFNLISILLLGMISFTANYLLIPVYGLTGAAAGSTLSILLFNLLKGGFLWFRLGIQPFNHQTIKALALLCGVYAVGVAMGALVSFPNRSGQGAGIPWALLWTMFWQGMGMLTLFVVALYRWRISPEMNGMMDSMARRLGWSKA
jgi:O-antigen/teichoic acid export membrane protein